MEKKELYLMEKTMAGPMGEMALANEIFHALQDQYFHIGAMRKVIHRNEDKSLAILSIIEGEATLGGFEHGFAKRGASLIDLPVDIGAMMRMQTTMLEKMQPNSALVKAPSR